jgi:ELWxxDGT repeat protein
VFKFRGLSVSVARSFLPAGAWGAIVRRAHRRQAVSLAGLLPAGFVAVAIAMVTPGPAAAQPAALVKDIATAGVNGLPIQYFGTQLVELDGALHFFADDGVHGRELWRSDGTAAGTWMVRDICPGQCVGISALELVVHQGALYFAANDGVLGLELWRSDGSSEGTVQVADVRTGSGSSAPVWLFSLGERLLFTASDEAGRELWSTDGTAVGTSQVLDIHPSASSTPGSFVLWKDAAWFTATDGTHGRELWTTDGTPGGTHLVKDVQPGPASGLGLDQTPLTRTFTPAPLDDLLLFPANDGVHGWELWASDGTEAGTELLLDIDPGGGWSRPTWLTPFAGEIFFGAEHPTSGRELWKSDGTPGGTVLLLDIEPGGDWSVPSGFTAAGGRLYFTASTSSEGHELWVTDGSAAETDAGRGHLQGPAGALVCELLPSASTTIGSTASCFRPTTASMGSSPG